MKTFLLPCALTPWTAIAPKAVPTHNAVTATMLVRINPSLGLCFVEKKPPRPGLVVAVACGFAVPPETWKDPRLAPVDGRHSSRFLLAAFIVGSDFASPN